MPQENVEGQLDYIHQEAEERRCADKLILWHVQHKKIGQDHRAAGGPQGRGKPGQRGEKPAQHHNHSLILQVPLLQVAVDGKAQACDQNTAHSDLEGMGRDIGSDGKPRPDACHHCNKSAAYDMPVCVPPVACHREAVGYDHNRLCVTQGSHRTQGREHSGDSDHVHRADS